MYGYDEDFEYRPQATMSDAHREWHLNAGVPMGQPGCPQDACHPIDEEEYGPQDSDPEHYEAQWPHRVKNQAHELRAARAKENDQPVLDDDPYEGLI